MNDTNLKTATSSSALPPLSPPEPTPAKSCCTHLGNRSAVPTSRASAPDYFTATYVIFLKKKEKKKPFLYNIGMTEMWIKAADQVTAVYQYKFPDFNNDTEVICIWKSLFLGNTH